MIQKNQTNLLNNYLTQQNLTQTAFNYAKAKSLYDMKRESIKKMPISTYDKVFYYYNIKTPMPLYAYKAFILLEMQLNSILIRTKLVPYLFMVNDLCFYRIVQVNNQTVNSPYYITTLYDSVKIPVQLYNHMYYRQYRIQRYPTKIALFFKQYWAHFTNYTQNKVWLLSNFVTSNITAEVIIFDYPNIILYMSPFRRFTKLYYKNQPHAPSPDQTYLTYTHTAFKLKLFEYASYYK